MIKKMVNLSFGAFFRTIGRIFAYLCIGFLILIIGAKSGLKLFLMPVKASEIAVSNAKFNLWTALSRDENICAKPQAFGYKNIDTNINTTDRPYVKSVQYLFNVDLNANQSYTITFVQSYNPKTDVITRPDALIYKIEASTTTSDSGLTGDNISSYKCFLTNDTNNPVKVNITCNVVPLNNVKKIWISQTHPNCMTKINGFNTYFLKVNQNSATEEAINNQTIIIKEGQDKINDSINNTNDTLNDDDTTEADSKITGFFNDFADNSHGLSSIVTAPLNAVNAMLTTTCTAPSATYKDSTFSFPCGSILWEQEGASALKTFINLIYGGLICYGIVKSLFKDVNDLKNPENDKVEVMNL